MNKLEKNYQLWYYSDGGYHVKEFDKLKELSIHLSESYTSDFYITKKCDLEIYEINGIKQV